VLYILDPAVYEAASEQAEAALLSAQASLEAIRTKEKRYRSLTADGSVSQQTYEDVAVALKQGTAAVAQAAAAAKAARINLEYTRVRASISGRIGASLVNQGALVTANQAAPLAIIQKIDEVYVDIPQSSAEFMRLQTAIRAGQLTPASAGETRLRLTLEDGTPYHETGRLSFADVTVDQSTGSLVLRAVFPNHDLTLLPGSYVRAGLVAGAYRNVLVIPPRAVNRGPTGDASAYVVDANNRVEQRKLLLGAQVTGGWIVESGVAAGERVIVIGAQMPKPGATVRIASDGQRSERRSIAVPSGTDAS
jgi:membrane fusion protein (multidrug efflux system)